MYTLTINNGLGYVETVGEYTTIDEGVKVWNELYDKYGEAFEIVLTNRTDEIV